MNYGNVVWREIAVGGAIGAGILFIWQLACSLWGWHRGESYGYSPRYKALYWDDPRFRHLVLVLTVLFAAGMCALGWQYLHGERCIGFFLGVLALFFYPLPAQLLVLAFKLYSVHPSQGGRTMRPGGGMTRLHGRPRNPNNGRDP